MKKKIHFRMDKFGTACGLLYHRYPTVFISDNILLRVTCRRCLKSLALKGNKKVNGESS